MCHIHSVTIAYQAAVVELLGAHFLKGGLVSWAKAKRVEADVSRSVVLLEAGNVAATGTGLANSLPAFIPFHRKTSVSNLSELR